MNPVAPKTFEVLKWVLHLQWFSQRMIARNSGISIGQVNKVFQWLEENNFIETIRKRFIRKIPENLGVVRYQKINATGILRAISIFRFMKNNLIFETNLDLKKQKVMDYMKKKKVIFCLDSALEHYDSYFRGDTICCYVDAPGKISTIKKDFNTVKYGITKIKVYSWDFKGLDIRDSMNSVNNYTTELQTIIDLFCDDKAHYTKELLKSKWSIEL